MALSSESVKTVKSKAQRERAKTGALAAGLVSGTVVCGAIGLPDFHSSTAMPHLLVQEGGSRQLASLLTAVTAVLSVYPIVQARRAHRVISDYDRSVVAYVDPSLLPTTQGREANN
jgi:hypothetical protein